MKKVLLSLAAALVAEEFTGRFSQVHRQPRIGSAGCPLHRQRFFIARQQRKVAAERRVAVQGLHDGICG